MTEGRMIALDALHFVERVSNHKDVKYFACKYAGRFLTDLNRTNEAEMTDIGCVAASTVRVNAAEQEVQEDMHMRATGTSMKKTSSRGPLQTVFGAITG